MFSGHSPTVGAAFEALCSRLQHANDFRRLAGETKGRGAENVNEIYSLSLHFGETMYIHATSAEKNPPETFGDSK